MAQYSLKKLECTLREKDLRVTPHRLALLVYLSRVKQPITVHELTDALRKKENVDLATVYRNLTSLEAAGVIRRLDYNHGHAHYELETGRASHSLVCNRCETIEKIEGLSTDETIKRMLKKSKKFKQTSMHSIEMYGLCKSCA